MMGTLLDATLTHLTALVACDTRNPPRAIPADGGVFGYLMAQLPGFALESRDLGAGAVSLLAVRGRPRLLFNVHMDTVPDSAAWTSDPFTLRVDGERAVGLGACDIKGAAAALLAAANITQGDAAFLFTSDEEANDPRGVADFLEHGPRFTQVIVAEPTQGKAVLAHRGIHSVRLQFHGTAGHASGAQARDASALHQAMRWGHSALAMVDEEATSRFGELEGLRFNIGRVEGGIKANVIAPSAEVRFNFRPLPSHDVAQLHARLCGFAPANTEYEETFSGPALPACAVPDAEARRANAQGLAQSLGLRLGPAVDFWTEASLFSAAGCDAIVYGPGDIAQAHTADEWVSLGQLRGYAESISRILSRTL